jgi:hypothetical protein
VFWYSHAGSVSIFASGRRSREPSEHRGERDQNDLVLAAAMVSRFRRARYAKE